MRMPDLSIGVENLLTGALSGEYRAETVQDVQSARRRQLQFPVLPGKLPLAGVAGVAAPVGRDFPHHDDREP